MKLSVFLKLRILVSVAIFVFSIIFFYVVVDENVSYAAPTTCSISFNKSFYCAGESYTFTIGSSTGKGFLHGTKNGVSEFDEAPISAGSYPGVFNPSQVGDYTRTLHVEGTKIVQGEEVIDHFSCNKRVDISVKSCICTPGSTESCTSSPNACSQTSTGTKTCLSDGSRFGTCSATTPSNPPNYGNICSSSANACGQTNTGTIQCDGTCSATTPSNSSCPTPVCSPSSQTVNVNYQNANFSATGGDGSYTWSAPGASFTSGGGSSFSATYNTTGTKTVTVTSIGKSSNNCTVDVKPNPYITGIDLSPSIFWLPTQNTSIGQRISVNLNGNNEKLADNTARYETKPKFEPGGTHVCSSLPLHGPEGNYNHTYEGDYYKGSFIKTNTCSFVRVQELSDDIGAEEKTYAPFLGTWAVFDRFLNRDVSDCTGLECMSFSVKTKFAYPVGAAAFIKSVSGNQITVTVNGSNYNESPVPGNSQFGRDYLDYFYRFIDNGVEGSWSSAITTNSRALLPNKFSVDQAFTCQNGRKVQFEVKNRYAHNLILHPDKKTALPSLSSQIDLSCTGISWPPGVAVDIKADGSNGPVSVANGSSPNLSWTATGGSGITCSASGSWSGSKVANGSEFKGPLTGSASYSYVLSCSNTEGGSGSDSVTINVSGPTLDATLSTSPSSGLEPLTTTLTANVSGTATGTITYKFDCTNDGTFDGTYSSNSTSQGHNCTYFWSSQNNGVYTAKVRVERQGASVEKTTTVTANQQTLSATLTANPTSGNSPLQVNFTATVFGTAVGTINYTFWKNCSYAGTSVSEGISKCQNPDKKIDNSNKTSESWNVTYPQIGTNNAKLIVERGVAFSAQNSQTINVLNNKPAVSNVKVTEPNYCFSGPAATVEWVFADSDNDPQSAYQVQVDDQGGFQSPEHDTGKISCVDCRSNNTGPGKLAFNKTYEARVKAWDSNNLESDWAKMSILCDSAGTCKSAGSWKTPKHTYPTTAVDLFSYTPAEPAANEEIQFTDKTKCFDDNNNQVACDTWNWTFGDGGNSVLQNPKHTYLNIGTFIVTEVVKDKDNLSCQASRTINISEKVPIFKEVSPKK